MGSSTGNSREDEEEEIEPSLSSVCLCVFLFWPSVFDYFEAQ